LPSRWRLMVSRGDRRGVTGGVEASGNTYSRRKAGRNKHLCMSNIDHRVVCGG